MLRRPLALVVGTSTGVLLSSFLERTSHLIYSPPWGLELLVARGVGAFFLGLVAGLIARDGTIRLPLIGGLFLLAGEIAKLTMVSHPTWFVAADVLLHLPFAILGGHLATKLLKPLPQG